MAPISKDEDVVTSSGSPPASPPLRPQESQGEPRSGDSEAPAGEETGGGTHVEERVEPMLDDLAAR